MGLNRGSVVLVKTKTVAYEGWVFSDDYEQDSDFEGKTLVMKAKSGKVTLKWTDIRLVILQWDAGDKSYNNTDYLGTEIKGGYVSRRDPFRKRFGDDWTSKGDHHPRRDARERGPTQEEWDEAYAEWKANRDVDKERMKAHKDIIKLMEDIEKERRETHTLRRNFSDVALYGGGALVVVWWWDPKGYEWLMWGTVPWAYAVMKAGQLDKTSGDLFMRWFDKLFEKYHMDVEDIFSDTAF